MRDYTIFQPRYQNAHPSLRVLSTILTPNASMQNHPLQTKIVYPTTRYLMRNSKYLPINVCYTICTWDKKKKNKLNTNNLFVIANIYTVHNFWWAWSFRSLEFKRNYCVSVTIHMVSSREEHTIRSNKPTESKTQHKTCRQD